MSTIFNQKNVLTRKSHVCFGCGREFPKGTIMSKEDIADAGTVWVCYLCKTCQSICSEMRYDDEFGYGDLREAALERESKQN